MMEITNENLKAGLSGYEDKTILLVEDEEVSRRFMAKVFERYISCKVVQCSNPKIAFDFLNNNIPDLIIMDLQMPIMDGLTAIKYIRSAERTANVPVIVCSALGFESIINTMVLYNVSDFIVKPADALVMIKKVVKVFNDNKIKN